MLIYVRKTVAYLLVIALMATSISRVLVAAELAQDMVFEEASDVVGHDHTHHHHALDSEDVGTWACLKYCVERAPDAGMIAKAYLSNLVPSEQFGLLHGPTLANSLSVIDAGHRTWPRGPPFLSHLLAPQKRHDILLRTARFRI